MQELIKKINYGFNNKDAKIIYTNLIEYFSLNNNVNFQKHPLGFKFFNIGKLSLHEELRIHIWDNKDDNQDNDLQIHDHSFNFESLVISGKIQNIRYELQNNLNSNGYIYRVMFVDNKSCLELISNNVEIKINSTEIITEGNFYFVNNDEFHESINIENYSITLLKMIKPLIFKSPIVYSPKKIKEFMSFKRSYLSKEESKEISKLVIEKCKNHLSQQKLI
jgi:hypothetical protein